MDKSNYKTPKKFQIETNNNIQLSQEKFIHPENKKIIKQAFYDKYF